MQTHRLTAHPAHPPVAVRSVEARIGLTDHAWLQLRWRVEGSAGLVIPPLAGRARADELWRTTCFELFCRSPGSAAYCELNLSPSERWAAYEFADYRQGMAMREMCREPVITPRLGRDILILDAALRLNDLPPLPWEFNPCAVLEEGDGVLSYWALEHRAEKPDFHDPACFAATLPAPGAP